MTDFEKQFEQIVAGLNIDDQSSTEHKQTLRKQMLDACKDAPSETTAIRIQPVWSKIMKNRMTQLTSAAAILIVALVGIHFLIGTGVTVTFAKAVEPILNAATISYDFIVGSEEDGVVLHDIVTEDRIRRTMDGAVMIVDLDKQTMIRLDTKRKEAAYLDIKGPFGRGVLGFNKFVRQLKGMLDDPDFEPEELGEQDIDGQKAVGFRAGGDGGGIVIWADAKTAKPIRVELGLPHQAYIIKNFEFNFPLDVSTVSMEVPQGYTLKETDMDLSNVTEQDFIAGLKVWVELLNDGQFPDELSPKAYMQNIPNLEVKVEALNLPEEEAEKLGTQYIKSMMFMNLFMVQGHSEPTYVGKGATFGDHDTAVFWYKPKGSDNYRVIYADLSVKEVTPGQLPK
jgi:outer membrane lipoprotein-sorting protein